MRIRCTECRKKVSIDNAFAGGVCRCPYCRALVFVADDSGPTEDPHRPASPMERPTTPEELKAVAESRGQKDIPLADPVKLQGIVTLVMIGVLVAMVVGGIVLLLTSGDNGAGDGGPKNGSGSDSGQGPLVDPFRKGMALRGSWVAGNVTIESPVIYIIDGGDAMRDLFDFALVMIRVSVGSLSEKDMFTVLLCKDIGGQDAFMDETGYRTGTNEEIVEKFLGKYTCKGLTDLNRSIAAAVARQPKTIVLLSGKPVANVAETAKLAKAKNIRIMAIAMGDRPDVKKTMADLARATGGHSRTYLLSDLDNYDVPQRD